jgi:hypothetical protein
MRTAASPGLRVMRLDQRNQTLPRDHGIHLAQEPLPARHFALLASCYRCKRPLSTHRFTPRLLCTAFRGACAELP